MGLSTSFMSSSGSMPAPSLARGPRGGCVAPRSSDNHRGRLGFPGAARRCRYRWWDAAAVWETLLGLQGRGAGPPAENSPFGSQRLVLSWICRFEMIPLGRCGSKSAKRNLEGNARGKRGSKEMESREMPGARRLVFLRIPSFPVCPRVVRAGTPLASPRGHTRALA